MELIDKKNKPKIWMSLNFWFGVIGIIGFLFSIYTFIFTAKPDLKYYVLANTSVLDVKEEVNNLNVTYDSINILESNQNISIILLEIKNIGTKDITLNDYDQRSNFGMNILGGKLLKKPELITSSDNSYYKNVISSFTDNTVKFSCKLIDQDQYFRIKLLVLHSKKSIPRIESIGKISGMDKIEVLSIVKSAKADDLQRQNRNLFMLFIASLIIGLLLLIIRIQRKANNELFLENMEFKNLQRSEESKQKIKNVLEIENLETSSTGVVMPSNIGNYLSLHETLKLKKGDFIYHERFGKGEVIKIEESKDIKDSKGEFNFEFGGTKRLLLRFAVLYSIGK